MALFLKQLYKVDRFDFICGSIDRGDRDGSNRGGLLNQLDS